MSSTTTFTGFLGIYSLEEGKQLPKTQGIKPLHKTTRFAFFQAENNTQGISEKNENNFLFIHSLLSGSFRKKSQNNPPDLASSIEELRGKYALISYQTRNGTSFLEVAADRYGSRPIFYAQIEGVLYFASTLNHILTFLPAAQRKISWEALYYSYHFRITPSDHTLVASINKVPAGHSLHCSNGKLRIKKYFDISALYTPANFLNASESELTEALNQAIAKAVKDHASCNRRIGLALSGGVDSGLIAVHLAKQNIPFKSYTFLYDGHYDELQRIERYSKHIKLDLTKIVLDTPTILKCFLEANATGSEPVSFNASLLQKMTACCQQDGVQTFFDGDGADRLFFGMNAHLRYVKMQMLYKFISEIRLNKFAGMLLQRSQIGQVQQLGNLFANWSIGIKPYPERHYDRDKPYDAAYENAIFKKYISRYWKHFQENFQSEDIRLYFAYQSIHMCPELFFYPAHEQFSRGGIENFSPFWNDEIVNLSLSMPQSWKTKQWKTKYILRKTGAQHFDPQYWTMPKIGLQNSFNYLISDKTGKEWYNTTCAAIKKTDEFIWLKEKGVEPKAERLLSFFQWRSGKGLVF